MTHSVLFQFVTYSVNWKFTTHSYKYDDDSATMLHTEIEDKVMNIVEKFVFFKCQS